jgi:hypothetical protein
MPRDIVVLFDQDEGRRLIERRCADIGLAVADLQLLIEEVIDKSSMQRRHGLWQAFDEILDARVGEQD